MHSISNPFVPPTIRLVVSAFLVVSACLVASIGHAFDPADQQVTEGHKSLELQAPQLTESSGLAFSGIDPNCVWSHNDSGGQPRLFGFDDQGKFRCQIFLAGVRAVDWEDMSAFVDEKPRLIVADVGDNDAARSAVSLYLFDEPNPRRSQTIKHYQHLIVHYPDGPMNCESVAVDTKHRRILLLGKSALVTTLYQIPLPAREPNADASNGSESEGTQQAENVPVDVVAEPVAKLALPMATGMDLCPRTGDLWITSYLSAYHYSAAAAPTLKDLLQTVPEIIDLPKLRQIEAIAVDSRGRVWVTSEGKPARLHRVVKR
jgi:hypothetical protein